MSNDGSKHLDRKAERARKLAEALRENLKRRKDAASDPAPERAAEPVSVEYPAGKPTSGRTGVLN